MWLNMCQYVVSMFGHKAVKKKIPKGGIDHVVA